MHTHHISKLVCAGLTAVLAGVLFACGGGHHDHKPPSLEGYGATSLVSDTAQLPAAHTDAKLVNAWGLAFNPRGFVWVAANGTAKSTLYDGNGVPQSLVVSTPAGPTGIVFNGRQDFKLSRNGVTAPSPFIFAAENGSISAWSPSVSPTTALVVVDGGAGGSVYKGLAISRHAGANYLYAADFHKQRIDVFDASFARVSWSGAFSDPGMPAGYAPFGIQAIGERIYVAYAKRSASGDEEETGTGLGIVSVYDSGGTLIRQLVRGGALNAPWGMALAPANFGSASHALLVGNFGDGRINAYDAETGAVIGKLAQADGKALEIDGLWGIAFGNGVNGQPANTLFYAAGPDDETHGRYGRIDVK
ncbi:TIGR03118 family protein [Janthinobacterium sp. 1_2014MBL_MicDiv]|uniref:TIGR03118 family protein n=1 Tax=Janthinobacterium sp. 1_2014MBL_MicDiv TaxID=1644131 RepID=UPI0008F47E5C|nr:TIGR03118 family protein [Janthinobacterium sp. 1_2014MBL_MicDiv]APA68370.1 NHL repeat family protein [Janthinobacterium sp. 1_2014MBL_MicDiv]